MTEGRPYVGGEGFLRKIWAGSSGGDGGGRFRVSPCGAKEGGQERGVFTNV